MAGEVVMVRGEAPGGILSVVELANGARVNAWKRGQTHKNFIIADAVCAVFDRVSILTATYSANIVWMHQYLFDFFLQVLCTCSTCSSLLIVISFNAYYYALVLIAVGTTTIMY